MTRMRTVFLNRRWVGKQCIASVRYEALYYADSLQCNESYREFWL